MPKKKKHPHEMTTEELVRHVFHPKVVAHLKRLANPKPSKKRKK